MEYHHLSPDKWVLLCKNGKLSFYIKKKRIGTAMLMDLDKPGAFLVQLDIQFKYRNKGHGAHLMHWMMAHAIEKGCGALSLKCMLDNKDALRFYQRLGFFIAYQSFEFDQHFYLLTKQL